MNREATPAVVVVDLRDAARLASERVTGHLTVRAAPESAKERVELWYASLEIPIGLEGMYYCG